MKARVTRTPVPECILIYHMEDELRGRIQPILEELQLPWRMVEDMELGQTVGYLTGLVGFEAGEEAPGEPFGQTVLVMQGLSSGRMDRFLAALRGDGIHIPLKAVVTPTNQHWTMKALCEEIQKEHRYMTHNRKPMHK